MARLRHHSGWLALWLALVASSSAGLGARAQAPVRLVIPAIPAALDGEARQSLEAMLATAREIAALEPLTGRVRQPCGLVVREGASETAWTRLAWRGEQRVGAWTVERTRALGSSWSRTRSVWEGDRVHMRRTDTMSYQGGEPECPNSARELVTRDAAGRIVSVRRSVETCEGVDSGTWVYRHVWRARRGYEEAIVRRRSLTGHDGPADLSRRVFIPSEQEAWAELGQGVFPTSVELRDEAGFLRARVEVSRVGRYAYACDGAEWPDRSQPAHLE